MRNTPAAQRAAKLIGIGELGASALTASVGDFKQFKSGGQFGAWLGIVPRQNSSGGKIAWGDHQARRRLPAHAADPGCQGGGDERGQARRPDLALAGAAQRSRGWQKACVAIANKNARILWAVMTREEGFDAKHVSVKPDAKRPVHGEPPQRPRWRRLPGLSATPSDQPDNTVPIPSTDDVLSKMH